MTANCLCLLLRKTEVSWLLDQHINACRLCLSPNINQSNQFSTVNVQAVSAGLVPLLLACMTKGSMALTIAAAEALMQITVGVKGKQAMVSHLHTCMTT